MLVTVFVAYCALYCIITGSGCLIAGMRIKKEDSYLGYCAITAFWCILAVAALFYTMTLPQTH